MKIGAFFDVDGTVLSVASGPLYTRFEIREGRVGWWKMAMTFWWLAQYKVGRLDMAKLATRVVRDMKGQKEADMIEQCDRWYSEIVRPYVRPQMIEAMESHRKQGHDIALLTAATIYLARPLGEELKVDGYVCNRLEVKDGLFTGEMVSPLCYGAGKIVHAKKYCEDKGLDLSASYFYTDSITDLDVLEIVGHPIIINPDPLLRREAKRRGWPIHDYNHDRRKGVAR